MVIAPKSSNALPDWRKDWRRLSARLAPPSCRRCRAKRLAEVDEKTRQIRDLAAREPATARTREFHFGILQKQRELLLDCHKRDQCVVAQLGAFSDAFEVIHGRLSAAQFSATEVASYMSQLVEQIVETERFVETLRPSMDGLMGGLDSERVARPTAVRVGGRGRDRAAAKILLDRHERAPCVVAQLGSFSDAFGVIPAASAPPSSAPPKSPAP